MIALIWIAGGYLAIGGVFWLVTHSAIAMVAWPFLLLGLLLGSGPQ